MLDSSTPPAPPASSPIDPIQAKLREAALEELRLLLRERKRRISDTPLETYEPLPHQARFHSSKAQERAFIGSNRCGKTESNAAECIRNATGTNPHWDLPVPNIGWVVSVSNEAQRDILQPKFLKLLPKGVKIRFRGNGIWDQLIFPNGSIIGFKSCEQGREALQGVALHWVSIDEEPPEEVFKELRARIVDYKGRIWLTFTPVNGMTWSYDRYVDEDSRLPGSETFGATMWDNAVSRGGYIPDEEIRSLELSIKDPAERLIRIYGQYSQQVGRVYKSFDRKTHVLMRSQFPNGYFTEDGKPNASFNFFCSIDTGRNFSAGHYFVDFLGNVVRYAGFFDTDGTIGTRSRAITNFYNRMGVWPEFIIDPTTQFFRELQEYGIHCNLGENDIDLGIPIAQEYMVVRGSGKKGPLFSNPRYYVVGDEDAGNARHLWEMNRYQWDIPSKSGSAAGEPKNKPRKKDDHTMDEMRYMLASKPEAAKPPPGTEDSRPIQQIIREKIVRKIKARREAGRSEGFEGGSDGLNDW